MAKISVVICCANSQDTLAPACQSVQWADEILVIDSGSADETPTIAQKYAHRYLVEPWRGYSGQKAFGAEQAKNDWVFVLDGDEECSDQLRDEILALTDQDFQSYDLFMLRRKNFVLNKPVRAWWPDWQSRLIQRKKITWSDDVLHENRQASDPKRVRHFKGWIDHKRTSQAGFSDYFSGARMDERLIPVAQQLYERGKRCGFLSLVFRPIAAFFKFYVLKKGFLDGAFGLLIAQKASVSTQLKYAALYQVQQEHKRNIKNKTESTKRPSIKDKNK